ncbi:MAG TPA: MFS transporter [Gemmatimonadaceae bacterium]|nr:MFS transporter [Gemmatimonadaceae bacterium]
MVADADESAVLRKVALRLIPFMALLYLVAFLDRVNVGFAALTMNADVGLSATAYGLGAGIFFIGYFLFEVPSNLILERVGARRWIARIMISWGLVSASTAFITGPTSFYLVRFLLGVAEAGFFPGMILYLTYWFPSAVRARVMSMFLVAVPVSNVVGGPISAALLGTSLFGLKGWQTMFIVEAMPAIVLGVVTALWLTDRPAKAAWLTDAERATLEQLLATERAATRPAHHLRDGLLSPRVWLLAVTYFGLIMGFYGLPFWLPQIVRSFGGLTNMEVGLLSVIPYAVASVGMIVWGHRSDRRDERAWHVSLPLLAGAAGFLVSGSTGDARVSLAALTVAAVGVYGAFGVFWTLPSAVLVGTAAAGGIALINSVGNLGGYVGPVVVGRLRDATGSYSAGLYVIAAAMGVAGVLVLAFRKSVRRRQE